MKVSPRFAVRWTDHRKMKHVTGTAAFNTTTPEGLPMVTFRVEISAATAEAQAIALRMTVDEATQVIQELQRAVFNAQREVTA